MILKRLQDAEATRDSIWAVIEGTAVNQDGRSNGMTAPNPEAQEQVLARALASARVSEADVDYIEAHGTGTPLGDPIEIESLCNVYRHPILAGSVKTNLGHLEAAAGMAGLIKTILAVRNGVIPPHLHFEKWNPAIVGVTNVTIPTRPLDWPGARSIRRAGVSAFSLGGTNAHAIVASHPVQKIAENEEGPAVLLPISAANPTALRELSESYLHLLDRCESEAELKDICYTASLRRTHYSERLAVLAGSVAKTRARLATRLRPGITSSRRNGVRRLVFVFPGQGLRWSRAGHELFASEPAFRESMLRSDALVRQMTGWSLIERWREPGALDRADIAQAAILALQLALTDLLETYGIVPSAVIGHSLGEATAACVGGVLRREDALRMLLRRGALVESRACRGRMVAFEVNAQAAQDLARPFDGRLSIAAFNSPTSTVLSGDCEAIEQICRTADSKNVRYVPLHTNYGFHSPQMRPLASELRGALENIVPGRQIKPMYSTVTGRLFESSSDYITHWIRNLTDPVRFTDAIAAAQADSYEDFLEIGPAALSKHIRTAQGGLAVAVLKKDRNERDSLLEALADLYSGGYDLAWENFFPKPRRVAQLPAYPWQRRRYWLATSSTPQASVGRGRSSAPKRAYLDVQRSRRALLAHRRTGRYVFSRR